jgi:hypothetical protein
MATTTTAATTTVQPETPPATTTTLTTMASQRITGNLQAAMQRAPGGLGEAQNPGSSRGPGGPEGPGKPGPTTAALAVPAGGNQPAPNPDDRIMGSLPQLFNEDCKLARAFLDQLTNYF